MSSVLGFRMRCLAVNMAGGLVFFLGKTLCCHMYCSFYSPPRSVEGNQIIVEKPDKNVWWVYWHSKHPMPVVESNTLSHLIPELSTSTDEPLVSFDPKHWNRLKPLTK